MCRIAAIISKDTHTLASRTQTMTRALQHGGPDGSGLYVNEALGYSVGHCRLSVIDTSPAGAQPMHGGQGRYCITYNGEIYNYQSLREQLQQLGHTFHSHTDTEVILNGYAQWGVDVLPRLKGMFAFVLADHEKGQLIAARDAMGIKPLYIARRGGDVYVSSEVRAFTAVEEGWEPNPEWRVWFLTFGFLPEPITTLQKVRPLPKGHYYVYDLHSGESQEAAWYIPGRNASATASANSPADASGAPAASLTPPEATTLTRQYVTEAIERHLVSDVPVGVFLSGGIDSGIITAVAAAHLKQKGLPLDTLSIEFEDESCSEKPYQAAMVTAAGTRHHSLVVREQDFAEAWDDIHASLDQPTTDAVNNYFICRFARRQGIKVVLSGLGADELFGGYPSFNRTGTMQRLQQLSRLQVLRTGIAGLVLPYPARKIDFLKKRIAASEYLTYRGLFTPADTARLLQLPEAEVWRVLRSYQLPARIEQTQGLINRVSALECDIYMLGQLLKDADMQSMWHGVELRVPFLDTDLVRFIESVPESVKYPPGGHKTLLVNAFKGQLPQAIVQRKKQGFVFPFNDWLGRMAAFTNSLLVPTRYYRSFQKRKLAPSRLWGIYVSRVYGGVKGFSRAEQLTRPTTLFMYLSAFGGTGGIEKVNRLIVQTLQKEETGARSESNLPPEQHTSQPLGMAYGLHDSYVDDRYGRAYLTRGFTGRRALFLWRVLLEARWYKRVIVGHLNLAPAVWLMKLRNPRLPIVVLTHGIEAWQPQRFFKKWLLQQADQVISVSEFTRQQLICNSKVDSAKIAVLPNALDVYFKQPDMAKSTAYLKKRYGIGAQQVVLLTVARMSHREQYKGYDAVLEALSRLDNNTKQQITYILAGRYDAGEYRRITDLIAKYQLQEQVQLPGFIEEDELRDHYKLADLFLMPSKMEGFGIVLIEAFASGTPVIAGCGDGSAEALRNGELGQLVEPTNIELLVSVIRGHLQERSHRLNRRGQQYQLAYNYYSPIVYKKRFKSIALS
jgi:asparagine synthase (glutamine-hydrolysing)